MAGKHVQKTSRLLRGGSALSGKQEVQKMIVTASQIESLKKIADILESANEKYGFQSETDVKLAEL